MEGITKESKAETLSESLPEPMTPVSTQYYIATGHLPPAVTLENIYITEFSSLTGEETSLRTLSPSAQNTMMLDTESEEDLDELTGYEDLAEVLELPYERFLQWATLKVRAYRQDVTWYASSALSYRQSSKNVRTMGECEWHAENATEGRTKSFQYEAPLILHILEEKKSARH